MTYAVTETSEYDGAPIELYKFTMGDSQWLYTNSDQDFVYLEEEYQVTHIVRGSFTKGNEIDKVAVDITVADSNPVALIFRQGWLTEILVLTIYRHHHGDSDYVVIWKGLVKSCKWKGSTADLITESVFSAFKKSGLRRSYQLSCPHVLYESMCGVDKSGYTDTFDVTDVAGNVLTCTGNIAVDNGFYTGGYLLYENHLRMITYHDGDQFTLLSPIDDIVIVENSDEYPSVQMWAGCDRSYVTCNSKFGNTINFGGLPHLPGTNPFAGNSIV